MVSASNAPMNEQGGRSAKDRVAQAYHDFGRFCSAHPSACLLMSILTMLVLSYPAIDRFRLPTSPIDVYWNDNKPDESTPQWLLKKPAVYVQQIIVQAGVDPWNSMNLTTEQAIRGPLSRAFYAHSSLLKDPGVDETCYHVPEVKKSPRFLPSKGCLILSPSEFWHSSIPSFQMDHELLNTIFDKSECLPNHCIRDLLLGMPTGRTGIKKVYQTNRKRTIDFSLTIFFAEHKDNVRQSIKQNLMESGHFSLVLSKEMDEMTYVHVFYHPRKVLTDYLPLLSSYIVFMIYLYYSARKFEMVSSRFGLAVAAAFNVAATLGITTGICAYLDILPTLWAADIFPYIALIVGLENTLCITRSVVNTPPSLDVSSRLAHGLSQEGYSLCKYFILELVFLLIGYSTQVAEIQEFCVLATIGLIVDFYMQLFFYAPCLTFDLQRLNVDEKQRFARMLFSTDIPHLKTFSPVNCPMRKWFPRMFDQKRWKKRRLSDSQLDEKEDSIPKELRRSSSTDKLNPETELQLGLLGRTKSARLRLLYFVTRTRIMQRTIMVLFAVWVVWLAFFVHSRSSSTTERGFGISHSILESAPLEWGNWQRRTFKWWPSLFAEYNISLDGQHITYLPPIVISAKIPPFDPLIKTIPQKFDPSSTTIESAEPETSTSQDLQYRVFWIETQLKVYLLGFFLLLLATVLTFILYVCFWDRWRISLQRWTGTQLLATNHNMMPNPYDCTVKTSSFTGHRFPVECLAVDDNKNVSSCQEGRICIWNGENCESIGRVSRLRAPPKEEGTPSPPSPLIWCLSAKKGIAIVGCCDGSIEVACLERRKLIGVYHQRRTGVVIVKLVGTKIIAARLDGTLDFIELLLTPEKPHRVASIKLIESSKAHTKPISHIRATNHFIISTSFDFTIKIFDLNGTLKHTLLSHNAAICSIVIDEPTQTLFTACEEGVICIWDLETAELVRTLRSNFVGLVTLVTSGDFIAARSQDNSINVWRISTGQSSAHLKHSMASFSDPLSLCGLPDGVIAAGYGSMLVFWELHEGIILRQVELPSTIVSLVPSSSAIFCCCGNTVYRVSLSKTNT